MRPMRGTSRNVGHYSTFVASEIVRKRCIHALYYCSPFPSVAHRWLLYGSFRREGRFRGGEGYRCLYKRMLLLTNILPLRTEGGVFRASPLCLCVVHGQFARDLSQASLFRAVYRSLTNQLCGYGEVIVCKGGVAEIMRLFVRHSRNSPRNMVQVPVLLDSKKIRCSVHKQERTPAHMLTWYGAVGNGPLQGSWITGCGESV